MSVDVLRNAAVKKWIMDGWICDNASIKHKNLGGRWYIQILSNFLNLWKCLPKILRKKREW